VARRPCEPATAVERLKIQLSARSASRAAPDLATAKRLTASARVCRTSPVRGANGEARLLELHESQQHGVSVSVAAHDGWLRADHARLVPSERH